MKRITGKKVEEAVAYLNEIMKVAGDKKAGNYRLSEAYGGYELHLKVETGGVCDVFRSGHITSRELYYRIHAFIDGFCAGSEIK